MRPRAGIQFANLYGLPHHKLFVRGRSPRCDGAFTNNNRTSEPQKTRGNCVALSGAMNGAALGAFITQLREELGENACAG
ncbi:MAG: hypothetical protein WBY24_19685, partial [Candidatus Acidiferrales bacterium]